jgi:gluconolactonase
VTQTASTIADKYNGKKLDSPNDDVVASDGSIWFTDPAYGIGGNYEGMKAEQEQEKHNVYQVDPKSGAIKVVDGDFVEPNGVTFSPDEKKLYIIDTGFTDGPDNQSHRRRAQSPGHSDWRPVARAAGQRPIRE